MDTTYKNMRKVITFNSFMTESVIIIETSPFAERPMICASVIKELRFFPAIAKTISDKKFNRTTDRGKRS